MKNPFEYETAKNLTVNEILDYYEPHFNYSRFLESKRNIFLLGERGSGKTMALLYSSFKIKYQDPKRNKDEDLFEKVAVHIPCITPLFHKREYLLLDNDYKAQISAEHYFVLSIAYELTDSLKDLEEVKEAFKDLDKEFKEDFEYIFSIELNKKLSFLDAVNKWVIKENINTQIQANDTKNDEFYSRALTMSTLLIPLMNKIKKAKILKNTHFIFLIDDAQDLNIHQVKVLNSWIAYRDHSDFSIKVATAKVNKPRRITTTGGAILEGHDFTTIDLEKPFYNKDSEFSNLAKSIVKRRLKKINNLDCEPEAFFPTNPDLEKGIENFKEVAKKEGEKKYGESEKKKVTDHIYKYGRAYYFRSRSAKANLPPYSGFDTIIDVSTGIVRNLLDPCYYMFDFMISSTKGKKNISSIPPKTQKQILIERSDAMWKRLQEGLENEIETCSLDQSKMVYKLFDNLMILFHSRLMRHKSEPRAIMFTISQQNHERYDELLELLKIAQLAQVLYTRQGNAKDDGRKETYYVPNRILLPTRGLDPKGQHARVSIKCSDLWNAASNNIKIPYNDNDGDEEDQDIQVELFG